MTRDVASAASGAATSPLLAFLDPKVRRARFSDRPRALVELPVVEGLLAGAADVDITPPPGMPKAGYSANAHHGSGFRTRLRARVIHLRAGTTSLAIVQCDLLGGSAVVAHLVAQAIADHTDVPLAGVFIGATHTHAGPGQYLGTDFYNRFASNKSGFDPAFAQFLVDRISTGIIDAVASRRPARLAIGTTKVWGLTRNRSLAAHVRNPTLADTSQDAQSKFHSVNPDLHLLRVDTIAEDGLGAGDPLAAMVVFSVHGTGVPMTADEYNADIWAYLVGELGHRIQLATGTRPVVGAIEGTHADVAPAIRPGRAGHIEAARLGRAIGAEAAVLHAELASQLHADVELGAGLREVELERDSSIDGITLPHRPAVGAALLGGAHENVTPVVHRIPPFAPGRPKPVGAAGAHGAKWVIGSRWLQPLVLPLASFPRVIPVQVLRLGDSMLIGLPFELTVETGVAIERRVRQTFSEQHVEGIDRLIVSSVANEYFGYATTAEEYSLQRYEGAHTLYGPATQPFLAAHAARLAGEVVASGVVQTVPAERRFDLKVRHHLARPSGASGPDRSIVGQPRYVDTTSTTDGYWEVEWRDVEPAGLHWHEPMIRVESTDGGGAGWHTAVHDGRLMDDRGWDLQVTHVGTDELGHRYQACWWDPAFHGGRWYRFVVVANNGRVQVASAPFR